MFFLAFASSFFAYACKSMISWSYSYVKVTKSSESESSVKPVEGFNSFTFCFYEKYSTIQSSSMGIANLSHSVAATFS